MNWGARQMLGTLTSMIRVVSGGGSAWAGLARSPRRPPVPATVSPVRNLRRVNGRAYWVFMESPFQVLVNATLGTLSSGLFFPRMNRCSALFGPALVKDLGLP